VRGFAANESGTTAIEYGLLAALMSVAIIAAMTSTGTSLNGFLTTIASSLR
jgi:pilus assembly protein Flp/PilA